MAIIIAAGWAILERVLDTVHSISSEGLSRHAYGQCGARAAVSSGTGANLLVRHAMGGDLHDVRVVLGQPRIDALGVCF